MSELSPPDASFWRRYPADHRPWRCEAVGEREGFSGGRVWRTTSKAGDFALRCWPPDYSLERVKVLHRVQVAAGQRGWSIVPALVAGAEGSTWTVWRQRIWELSAWRPGRPADEPIPNAQLVNASRILARWHSTFSNGDLGWEPTLADDKTLAAWRTGSPIICPAARRRRWEWERLRTETAGVSTFFPGDSLHLAQRTIISANTLQEPMERWLTAAERPTPLRLCLRDVHREHVLFVDSQATGLIDFGALGVDTPAADLARWLGSVLPDRPANWPAALAAYREQLVLSEETASLIEPLERTGTVIGALHWLEWLVLRPRPFQNLPVAYARWRSLVERLESWLD